MIAAALRTEIELFSHRALERCEFETLACCATAAQRLMQGDRAPAAESSLPAMRALAELVERAALSQPAALLAYRALAQQLMAHVMPSSGAAAAREDAFDAIDELVDDPTELPLLRASLRSFCESFQHLCQEATRAPRRSADRTVSAA